MGINPPSEKRLIVTCHFCHFCHLCVFFINQPGRPVYVLSLWCYVFIRFQIFLLCIVLLDPIIAEDL